MSGKRQNIQYSLALEPVDQGETRVTWVYDDGGRKAAGYRAPEVRVPGDRDHGFQWKAIIQSSGRRSRIPVEGDHSIE